ncbi:hypothetical protein [Pseudoalteromonas sp. T1lg23B]|uniref:hypothetical protein n=1 Tax=Pseudoalteromonas sp. T1lg23B TaxID=2077097 RepID=UPI000CF7317F|nr:hypothetical protein [Pseudoalteromonas sp. T1lg23B]
MTLAVVWNSPSGLHFASDSRISKGDKSSDYGVKIVPVHVKVFEPAKDGAPPPVAFDSVYGMCFAGEFSGASVIRNFLAITLQRLQFVPTFTNVSFLNICKIVDKIYAELSTKLQSEIETDSIDFFLAGYCPHNKRTMLAKFYIDYGDAIDKFEPKYEIISYESASQPIYYIGSGENEFSLHLDIHKEKPISKRPLYALQSLIKSGRISSVGGNIQVGTFDSNNEFYMLGIAEEHKDENGLIRAISYYYAGIDMNSNSIETDDGAFMVMGNFVDPFRLIL